MGGGRYANVSMLEAIALCEELTGRPMSWSYVDDNRIGDHIWWISDIRKFQSHYPGWRINYDIKTTLAEIYEAVRERAINAKVTG
jgi:CDP-paratose 2-epimerase